MVIRLDSASKQLQWQLIYANFDVDSVGFTGCGRLFCERSIPLGTEATTDSSYPAANAQGVGSHSETGSTEGKSIATEAGNPGQYAHRSLDPKAASLPDDRRPDRSRWPSLVWQTRTRNAARAF